MPFSNRRQCNRPQPTQNEPIPFIGTSTTSLRQAANPDDVVPILKFFGASLVLAGGAVLFGMGSKMDERKRQTLERQEYKRYLQRQAAEASKPKKVYPKGPKQVEAERKWAGAEQAAKARAEAAQREAEQKQVAMRLAAEEAAREQAEREAAQMEMEAARRRMEEVEAAESILEEAAGPSKPSYLGAIDEVCEAPPVAAGVQPSGGGSNTGINYLDAIAEVCESPDGTTVTSIECAGAISNYIDALSLSAAQPIDAGPGIANYLDSIANAGADDIEENEDEVLPSTTPAVADYLNALSSGQISPPSATSVKSFIDEVASGALPGSGASIAGYLASLDAVSNAASRATGQGVPTYLDTVAAKSGPSVATGGGGDNNVAASSTEVKHYLDELQGAKTPRANGSGVPSYLDSVASSAAGPSLSVGAASGPTSYLQSIGSSQQNAPNVAIDTTSKTETKRNEDGSFTIERQVAVVIGDGES